MAVLDPDKDILLFSGGLDSVCVYKLLEQEGVRVQGLYIPHDLQYSYLEDISITHLTEFHGMDIVKFPTRQEFSYFARPDGFIPLRNLLLCTLAGMAGAKKIYLGAVAGEYTLDKSDLFFQNTESLFSYLLSDSIQIEAPYASFTKTELVKKALDSKAVTPELLEVTWSCYEPVLDPVAKEMIPCGECMACIRRWLAMVDNGIYEKYASSPRDAFREKAYTGDFFELLRKQPTSRWKEIIRNNVQAYRIYRKHRYE